MQLYLVRHGESEYNRIGEEAGSDSPLSELGWLQAERLGAWLATRGPFDAFYCSPLLRARQTAEVLARYVPAPAPTVLETLRESDFHMIDFLPRYAHPLDPARGRPLPAPCEEYAGFRRQIEAALETIIGKALEAGHQRLLVVSHGATMGTMIRTLLGVHHISIWSQNCCVHCLVWEDSRWEIRYMNRKEFLADAVSKGGA